MFVLKEDTRFEWPVDVEVPAADGKTETHRFTAIFAVIPTDRMEKDLQLPLMEQDQAISLAALAGWKDDVKDDAGDPVKFNDVARDRMLAIPYVRSAVVRAYFEAIGGGKAARKN